MTESLTEIGESGASKGDNNVQVAPTSTLNPLHPPIHTQTETGDDAKNCMSDDANNSGIGSPSSQQQCDRKEREIKQSPSPPTTVSDIPISESLTTPNGTGTSPSASVPTNEVDIEESLSEISLDYDHTLNSSIRNFFYPSKQPPLQKNKTHRREGKDVERNRDGGRALGGHRLRSNASAHSTLSPTLNHAPNTPSVEGEYGFEDEHDSSGMRSPGDIHPSSFHRSSLASPVGSVEDGGSADFVAQEQQDKAFVEKFWTAYDEILILSIFTQVGILCRLGAAYFFRYFDNVFHSDSALFTNLPLNCLSCFVMGLLCSGESLMQIIGTRFTPPRLQRDLHREPMQQFQDEALEHENSFDEKVADRREGMIEMRILGNERKGWRRRGRGQRRRYQRRNNEERRRFNRLNSLVKQPHNQQAQNPDIYNELREVQLMAWERRIRASICLLLFPVKKEDVDIVETYFSEGYKGERSFVGNTGADEEKIESSEDCVSPRPKYDGDDQDPTDVAIGGFDDLIFEEEICNSSPNTPAMKSPLQTQRGQTAQRRGNQHVASHVSRGLASENSKTPQQGRMYACGNVHVSARQYGQLEGGNIVDYGTQENPDLDQIISNVATGVSNNISMISRVNLANGWDVGTSPQEKSEDLTLGLRDGLCGALSSFSSWISSMVNLFRAGQIGQAFVGLMLGIQLPIVAYRFGQHVSVYVFVWRCRREKGRDERRGYGIQVHTSDEEVSTNRIISSPSSIHGHSFDSADDSHKITRTKGRRTVHDEENDVPSIRAIFTALFIMCLVAQLTSLTFFKKPEDRLLALSLLFSPLGVLARWRMMKFNSWRPSFPLGTFACNVTACALSGTLGSLLAGNPGPRERVALVSVIAGFGGTLSSVARFIVEILSLMDPILFRLDGIYYAVASLGTGLFISFLSTASVDWADSIE